MTSRGSRGLNLLSEASSHEALHDSAARYPPPRCHPGTRQGLLLQLNQWVLGTSSEDNGSESVWISGPAGAGKTALAQTLAEMAHEQGFLGASFFFSRPNARDDPKFLFTTLAYQLAVNLPEIRLSIEESILRDPALFRKSLAVQFQELILGPVAHFLASAGPLVEPRIIIIDALDECSSGLSREEIVRLVTGAKRHHSVSGFLRWIIFSRLDPHILATFPFSEERCRHLSVLVSRQDDSDIELLLWDGLSAIRNRHPDALPATWPGREAIQKLIEKCSGLFLYASIIVSFIGDASNDPEDQLAAVLQSSPLYSRFPFKALDMIYVHIIEQIPRTLLLNAKQIIAGSMITTLPLRLLVNILGISRSGCYSALQHLHSVASIPDASNADHGHLEFLHASFVDFLCNRTQSGRFAVPAQDAHYSLGAACLRIITEAGLSQLLDANVYLSWPTSEVQSQNTTDKHPHDSADTSNQDFQIRRRMLAYAVAKWGSHFSQSSKDRAVVELLLSFDFGLLHQGDHEYTLDGIEWLLKDKTRKGLIRRYKLSLMDQIRLGSTVRNMLASCPGRKWYVLGKQGKEVLVALLPGRSFRYFKYPR